MGCLDSEPSVIILVSHPMLEVLRDIGVDILLAT
jgi:hypothetical protein